jgi:hypothetical protein
MLWTRSTPMELPHLFFPTPPSGANIRICIIPRLRRCAGRSASPCLPLCLHAIHTYFPCIGSPRSTPQSAPPSHLLLVPRILMYIPALDLRVHHDPHPSLPAVAGENCAAVTTVQTGITQLPGPSALFFSSFKIRGPGLWCDSKRPERATGVGGAMGDLCMSSRVHAVPLARLYTYMRYIWQHADRG